MGSFASERDQDENRQAFNMALANIYKNDELRELVKPIKEWADENLNPHQMIIIEHDHVRVVGDEFGFPLKIQD